MKTLYLDIFSGISGDMFIGALLDLGVPFEAMERELAKLNVEGFHLHATRQHKSSIEGVKFDVHLQHHGSDTHPIHQHSHGHAHTHEDGTGDTHGHTHSSGASHSHDEKAHEYDYEADDEHEHEHKHEHSHGRTFAEIRELISRSKLSKWVQEKSIAVFERIARAEGKIHGMPAEQVHFHEVGAVDSIIDIVGGAVCLDLLGRPKIYSAPVTEGTGWIKCAHGRFPIPAPATIAILAERGVPLTQCEEPNELVTPTGAALLAELVEDFGPLQLTPEKIGYGLGERNNRTRPNVLRVILGTSTKLPAPNSLDWETDHVAVLETNLDNISAEILGYVVEKALTEGALDVFHTPIQMKKNRPGVLLTILCDANQQDLFTELLLRETSAMGVRRSLSERRKLRRQSIEVQTDHGKITVKIGLLNGKIIQAAPEFESCRQMAIKHNIALKHVYAAALAALPNEPAL